MAYGDDEAVATPLGSPNRLIGPLGADGMNVVSVDRTETVSGRGELMPAMTARAAEYVRMSTEHQKYSTENQQRRSSNMPPAAG